MSRMSEMDLDRQQIKQVRGEMQKDPIEKLASDVRSAVIKTSAKVAELHRIPRPENEYQRGYNAAVFDIAAKIRRL